MNKIGFACKYYHPDRTLKKANLTKTSTHKNLQTLSKQDQTSKLLNIVKHNIQSVKNTLDFIFKELPTELHMYRISSDLLPLYTHKEYKWFWKDKDVQDLLCKEFEQLGKEIKSKNILISFHPGQFVVLASEREEVVTKSIEEFEYHIDMARWMGFGKSFQDGCKVNVHVGGRLGPQGIIKAYDRLSLEARNLLTIENDEFSWGLDDVLFLREKLAIVLDIHHHWIKSGEYISSKDDRVKQVIESWRGVTPTMHYSLSPEEILVNKLGHPDNKLPTLHELLQQGIPRTELRAHSDYYWNQAANEWVCTFSDRFNIMCEAKTKHNAALQLLKVLKGK